MARSPLSIHPYLWAVGQMAAALQPPQVVEGRYKVIAPQIWQDIYPEQAPTLPDAIPTAWQPYLRLYPHRLHVPEVYGLATIEGETLLLLHNAPLDERGRLLPSLESVWLDLSPIRQALLLWQLVELWPVLQAQGVASSLLVSDNLRVDGQQLRLMELFPDRRPLPPLSPLVKIWLPLARQAHYSVAASLANIAAMLQQENPSPPMIQRALNRVLLEQAAQLPLTVQVASATDPGSEQLRNEDAIYPPRPLAPTAAHQVLVVCDGIGGHAEGAIASQAAVQSLQLQGRALVEELRHDPTLMEPEQVRDQILTLMRVANNLIANRNDAQNRSSRQRMATTAVLALQLPQIVETPDNRGTSHELYLAHIGDSRAYWITADACKCLTVDHDIIGREVSAGHQTALQARQRPDAGALTQALGTRSADRILPTIQRFVIEEDGILLLCTDGLSDRYLLERSWTDFAPEVLRGTMTLQAAVDYLIQLARQHNGHDNVSAVAALYRVTRHPIAGPTTPVEPLPAELESAFLPTEPPPLQVEAAAPPPPIASERPEEEIAPLPVDAIPLEFEATPAEEAPTTAEEPPEIAPPETAEPEEIPAELISQATPTFADLDEVQALLQELTQPVAGDAPTTSPLTESNGHEPPEELERPAPPPADPSETPPAATVPHNTGLSSSDTYTPNPELPPLIPTWDNPNPWAAATPPPFSPPQTTHDFESPGSAKTELPAYLFEQMMAAAEDDDEETTTSKPFWSNLGFAVIAAVTVIAMVVAIAFVMRQQFSQDASPSRTEQAPE